MNNSTTDELPPMVDAHFSVSMIVINAFSCVLATVLNFLVIMAFAKTPSLRTPSNVLIISLAITDFWVGALVQPVYCISLFADMTGEIVFIGSVREVLRPIGALLLNISIFTTTAITVDRFLALHFHLRYQELVTTKRTSMVVIMIWTLRVVWTVLDFLVFKKISAFNAIIFRIESFVFLSLMLFSMALMLKISRVINEHAAHIQRQQRSIRNAQPGAAVNIKRSVNVMYYILGTFLLCYFPFICFSIINAFSQSWKWNSVNTITYDVVHTILLINSSINPIIYFWRIQGMRNAALQLLRSIRRNNEHNNFSNSINNNNNNNNNDNNGENNVNL